MVNVYENSDDLLIEICNTICKMYNERESIWDTQILNFYCYLKEKETQITSRLIELNDKDILQAWRKISFYWERMGGAAHNNVIHRNAIYSDGLENTIMAAIKIKNKLIAISNPQKRFTHICESISKYRESVDVNNVILETVCMQISYNELIEIYEQLPEDDKDIKEDCMQIGLALDIYIHSNFKTEHEKLEKYKDCLLTIKRIATKRLQKIQGEEQKQITKK